MRVQENEEFFIVVVIDVGSECCAAILHHRLLIECKKEITRKIQKSKVETYPVPCGIFPAPSNDAVAVLVPLDAVAEAAESIVDELEVSVAYISACFERCRGDYFQDPVGKIWKI